MKLSQSGTNFLLMFRMDLSEIILYFIEPSLEMKPVIKLSVIENYWFFLKLLNIKSHFLKLHILVEYIIIRKETPENMPYGCFHGPIKELLCCAYGRRVLSQRYESCFLKNIFFSFLILLQCQIKAKSSRNIEQLNKPHLLISSSRECGFFPHRIHIVLSDQ